MINTGCVITRNVRHIKKTPITTEQYLKEKLAKNSRHTMRDNDICRHYELNFCKALIHPYTIICIPMRPDQNINHHQSHNINTRSEYENKLLCSDKQHQSACRDNQCKSYSGIQKPQKCQVGMVRAWS